ncbi:probable tubulin polyglutamylase ttll-15 [Ischnura elegans]|uniref:probable tubulin polyglutamylase ttll-15 n=1 Tax=Ischnura elegans TaxID=197161 RepID=UPI001ED87CB8|nr:probable tubulin polyglutamylase ttll-15 [Ischnura elegans]
MDTTKWSVYSNYISYIILAVGIALSAFNVYDLTGVVNGTEKVESCQGKNHALSIHKPTVWIRSRSMETGYLKHVKAAFERIGYEIGDNSSDWDVLWSHEYPFKDLKSSLVNMMPHQKVNHFPGCGYITNKVSLSTSGASHIPSAFKLPEDKDKLLEYASINKEMLFVQKSNSHRGIKIEPLSEMNLESSDNFVQQYISNPLLIDGYKFDIGVYTILTSIDPLRVYAYDGDVLFRFCPEKYHPFDPKVVNKYVVGDDYLPIWNVPSLKNYYNELGFSMKDSFNAYLHSIGKDSNKVWSQVYEAIADIYLLKEPSLIESSSRYKRTANFFEMVRIDFIIDEDLNVFIMEANMSPNLSSAHFPPNQLLYEQVMYNLLSLVGIGTRIQKDGLQHSVDDVEEMQVSFKNLAVEANSCSKKICSNCIAPQCLLCKPCLTTSTVEILKSAYLEHENRLSTRRIFPPPLNAKDRKARVDLEHLSPENQLMYYWFEGMCRKDVTWCT